ncbi:hypothetical protein D3C87_1937970 [compost metagenome]
MAAHLDIQRYLAEVEPAEYKSIEKLTAWPGKITIGETGEPYCGNTIFHIVGRRGGVVIEVLIVLVVIPPGARDAHAIPVFVDDIEL